MKYLVYIFSLILFVSCSDERIISDVNLSWKALVVVDYPNPELIEIEYPSAKIVGTDLFQKANGKILSSVPNMIASFGNFYFLLQNQEYKINVLDKNFAIVSEIEFDLERKPIGIAFPNSTSAYVIFENDSLVSVIDLTIFKEALQIQMTSAASSIASSGSKVYVTEPLVNSVSVIDTRTNKVEKVIKTPEYPLFVSTTNDGRQAVVVSAGSGKFDTSKIASDAYISLINYESDELTVSQPLGIGIVNPKEQIPSSLANTGRNYSYISTQNHLLRFNSRTGGAVARVLNGNYESVIYNFKRDEVILVKDETGTKRIQTSKAEDLNINFQTNLPAGFVLIIPL